MRCISKNIFLVCTIALASLNLLNAAQRPNILFIVADDMGIMDLGVYGSDYYLTPNLNKLASQSMRFDRAYAASHVCSPTRGAILTGRYPQRIHLTDALPWDRLYKNPKMIPPNHVKELSLKLPTFARVLQKNDYRTAMFGKWHLGNEERFFTGKEHKAYGFDEAFGVSGKAKAYDKGVNELTERTLRFLKENKKKPFMLCLMHHVPHVPVACPPYAKALYDSVPKGKHQKNSKYAGMISHFDNSIKKVLDALRALGLDDNTVVIVTSDNGGLSNLSSNKPYNGGKGSLYEGGTRVPLLIRWPGKITPGSVNKSVVISNDFFPTFLELAGLPLMPEAHLDGKSMMPLLKGKTLGKRTLYWHFPHRGTPGSSIIDGDLKLIHKIESDTYEMFDLNSDPYEANNLFEKQPEQASRLQKMLARHLKEVAAQEMSPNPQWDPKRPKGKPTNFGIHYPAGRKKGFRLTVEAYPEWFKLGRLRKDR
ncbi:putative exported uslfatase [Lentisphaera araneosa HTCC2155]|uniref:Putative exported uslfatase n=1 Tax=Lentisphaera araneosa HTCC2155 TaxID=313628 RepID=A6DMW2_9BACT|nr:sulfatase [Lentisphaera araneosa]EDM26998.1 putative exported uslfatase [Lentisphaera araneosa HTCC2155]